MNSVSVVIPLFNKGPHIERAISSVLKQTRNVHEIIVVDDGSSDAGPEIVAKKFSEVVKFITRGVPGPGGYAARNVGIQEATGEWIAFLDADDEWEDNHISLSMGSIELHQSSESQLVGTFSGYRLVSHSSSRLDPATSQATKPGLYDFSELLSLWIKLGWCPIWTSASLFKREKLLEAGLFPEHRCRRGGDKDLWLRMASLGKMAFVQGVSATYYKDSVNMVTKSTRINTRHCICDTIVQMIESHPEYSKLLKKLYNTEVFDYAQRSFRAGNLHPDQWGGFYAKENPAKFVLLNLMSFPPILSAVNKKAS